MSGHKAMGGLGWRLPTAAELKAFNRRYPPQPVQPEKRP